MAADGTFVARCSSESDLPDFSLTLVSGQKLSITSKQYVLQRFYSEDDSEYLCQLAFISLDDKFILGGNPHTL